MAIVRNRHDHLASNEWTMPHVCQHHHLHRSCWFACTVCTQDTDWCKMEGCNLLCLLHWWHLDNSLQTFLFSRYMFHHKNVQLVSSTYNFNWDNESCCCFRESKVTVLNSRYMWYNGEKLRLWCSCLMDVRFILGQFKLHQKKVQSWQIQGKIIGNSVWKFSFPS